MSADTKKAKELSEALAQAADGYPNWVKELLAEGANPNGFPLIMAIQCDEAEIVQMMIDAGVEVNTPYDDTTPLIRAITASYPDIVKLLILAGADVNQVAPDGTAPLTAARIKGRLNITEAIRQQIIQLLINAGAHE